MNQAMLTSNVHRAFAAALDVASTCAQCRAVRQCSRNAIQRTQYRGFTSSRRSRQDVTRDYKLPTSPARTRFAPSPTGYMHIGGLRTALFSYLLAKRTGGQFVLRIEDTDQKRFVDGAIERLCEDLQWAGIQWDEGPVIGGDFGPYQQSQRTAIYQEHAGHLLKQGSAYRCFCVSQATDDKKYVTSGCYQDCATVSASESSHRSQSEAYTVRLKPPLDAKTRKYPDLVYGNIKRLKRTPGSITVEGADEVDASDTILMKSDGTPTYHFANVVDDHLMKITHVIRGTEWMASTPLHYDLYTAFGWQPPLFAHVGLLLDENKAKLSKRNADIALDVQGLRDEYDILPQTLCNYLALQGWSNFRKDDVMDMAELIQNFDLKFTTGNTIVTFEKMWFLQRNHVLRLCEKAKSTGTLAPIEHLVQRIVSIAEQRYPDVLDELGKEGMSTFCAMILLADNKSYQTAEHFVDRNAYFFRLGADEVPQRIDDQDVDDVLEIVMRQAEKLSEDKPSDTMGRFTAVESMNAWYHTAYSAALLSHVLGPEHEKRILSDLGAGMNSASIIDKLSADSEADLTRYKGLQKVFMKCLREQLCGGKPGPSMGMVMAILGVSECKKRLAR